MKKAMAWLLVLCFLLLSACAGGQEDIVDELEGPEGIDHFAGLWYYEFRELWIEIYYDGAWCSFTDGGLLRSYGDITIEGDRAHLEPTEGVDRLTLLHREGLLTDERGEPLIPVTEVGITRPKLVNDSGAPDTMEAEGKLQGEVDQAFCAEYQGFYISEDGVYALEIWDSGAFELQEYGLVIESGQLRRMNDTDHRQIYTVDPNGALLRLILPKGDRLYIGGIGTFAHGEKGSPEDG